MKLNAGEKVVKTGTFLYDGTVTCEVDRLRSLSNGRSRPNASIAVARQLVLSAPRLTDHHRYKFICANKGCKSCRPENRCRKYGSSRFFNPQARQSKVHRRNREIGRLRCSTVTIYESDGAENKQKIENGKDSSQEEAGKKYVEHSSLGKVHFILHRAPKVCGFHSLNR